MVAKVETNEKTIRGFMESLGEDGNINLYLDWMRNGVGRILSACSADGGLYGMLVVAFLPNPDISMKYENSVMIYDWVIDKDYDFNTIMQPMVEEVIAYADGKVDVCINLQRSEATAYFLTHGFTNWVWDSSDDFLAVMSYNAKAVQSHDVVSEVIEMASQCGVTVTRDTVERAILSQMPAIISYMA